MNTLTIPDRLYGRDQEIDSLLASFERIGGGLGEVLLVPGSAGVGKTALVRELRTPIRERNGFFVQGKFDQYQQNVPYFAFRQALAELCREMQGGDASQRSRFKTDIEQAVGSLGQVLVDLVPEFEVLLGPQSPLEEISPREAQHRFAGVCRSFLNVVCLPEHPLILFLDDWQWADAASCELLRQLQIGTALRHVLVIVSYRDEEVYAGHPLMRAVDDLRSQAVPVAMMHVQNITAGEVLEIVTDTLQPAAADVAGLAALIHGKTLGNPFFVRSFLGFLHKFGLIWFDEERNCWQWRSVRPDGMKWPGDVVELFVLKLRRLDPQTQHLFSLASCLGNRFDLDSLGIISGRDPRECLTLLLAGEAETLLRPLHGDGRPRADVEPDVPQTFVFLHDRVQQAAHSLIEPGERPRTLLEIGRTLLASLQPAQLAERLFEVVSNLNAGRQLMRDAAEQTTLVSLNIAAARRAFADAAYSSALQFYRAAHDVLEASGLAEQLWRDSHRLMMQLFMERAECEFLEGSRAEAEECIRQAVARAGTAIEKSSALNVLIVQYTLLARYPEAIAAGRRALDALGISLPEDRYEEARDQEIAQLRRDLGNRPVASLADLPVMSDAEMIVASRILITMGPPCYRSHQRLWGVIVPKVVNLTLRHGNIPQVGYSHTAFGGLLAWVDGDYAMAREFGELATQLMTSTFRTPADQSVFFLMIGSSNRHWFKHLRYGTQDYADAYDIGLRSGNLQYAAYAFGHDMYCRFYQGVPLALVRQEVQRSLEFSRVHVNQWAMDLLEGGQHIFADLAGDRAEQHGSEAWSEGEYLQRVAAHHNIQVRCIYQVLKTSALLVSGEHAAALAMSDETEPLIYTVGTQGLLPWPEHVFARVLILTALHATADEARRSQWRAELEPMLGQLRVWADHCPDNFAHKYLLASAELARIDGRFADAMQLYDQAVEGAHAGSFLQWEGLANERASGFWMTRGNERLAQVYWQQAYVCYDRWGAGAKVRAMEAEYRMHLIGSLAAQHEFGAPAATLSDEGTNAVMNRQIRLLRNYASEIQQGRLRGEATARAQDLAHAMQRVRVEIAERKRTEDALRESERMLKESQVIASLGWYDLDIVSGRWTSSEVLDAVFGIDKAFERSVEGWLALIHPDDRAMMADYLSTEVLGQGRMFEKLYRIVRHDDQVERWVHGLGRLEYDAAGHPVRLRGTIQDVTARKRTEEDLRKLSRAVEQSPASILITNVRGDIEYVNEAFLRTTGYAREDVLGRNPRFLQSGATPQATYTALWEALTRGATWTGEFHNRRKDGSVYVEMVIISPLRQADGVVTHYVAVKEDVTTERQIQAELAQHREHLSDMVDERTRELVGARELAEAANLAKSAFLATMSHEIRTPLNGVIAMAEILTLRPLPPEDLDLAHTIDRAAHNLLTVIDNILDFSKIEAGKLVLEVADLSLHQLADDLKAALFSVAVSGDVDLVVTVAPDVPAIVRGDAARVRQILMNLTGNAIKFSGRRADVRGHVSVSVDVVSVTPLRVSFRVSDNGIGMSPATQSRLFTSFTQADTSTTRRFGGSGLGLAISRRLVDIMEGTIDVTSTEGRGSTFTVMLPFHPARPDDRQDLADAARDRSDGPVLAQVPSSVAAMHPRGRLILVAEDDAMNRKVILRQLSLLGYACEVAVDGMEALHMWRAGAYALLLSDLHMPVMDGYELVTAIRREEAPGVHLPIIALTANALRGEAERTTAAGMDGYLTKPVPLAMLRDVLAQWIAPEEPSQPV